MGVEEDDFVDEEFDGFFPVAVGLDEEEEVVDLVAGGEGGVGAVVAAGVAGEVEVVGLPGAGLEVTEVDVAVVLHGEVEDLDGEAAGAGEVGAEAQLGARADGFRRRRRCG